MSPSSDAAPSGGAAGADTARIVGRYELLAPIGVGGMATVFVGRVRGDAGFSRLVAVKKLHEHFSSDAEAKAMFIDEARLASQIRHPNVVSTLDVVELGRELFIVMEYVEGVSVSQLLRTMTEQNQIVPPAIVATIGSSVMQGLHAAHEAVDEKGLALGIIHRDVSPHNVMLGSDGIVRVVDFGVAKASGRAHTTRDGQIKGKLAYMAPEQLLGGEVDRRADIFSAGALLWELSTGRRLFHGASEGEVLHRVLEDPIPAPGTYNPRLSPAFDAVVLRALERDPARRFETAESMARALEAATAPVAMRDFATWIRTTCSEPLAQRAALVSTARAVAVRQDPETATAVETHHLSAPVTTSPFQRRLWTAAAVAAIGAGALVLVWRVRGTSPATTRPEATLVTPSGAAPPAGVVEPLAAASIVAPLESAASSKTAPPASHSAPPPVRSAPVIRSRAAPRGTARGPAPKATAPTASTPIYSRD